MNAELIAYEGFEYSLSNAEESPDLLTDGLDGGIGWEGAWESVEPITYPGAAIVQEGSLSYTDAEGRELETQGHHALIRGIPAEETDLNRGYSPKLRRTPANLPPAEPRQRVYLSFLGQRRGDAADPDAAVWQDTDNYPDGYPFGDNLYPRNAGLQLHSSESGGDSSAIIGNLSNQTQNFWSLISESSHVISETPFTELAFVVVRLDYTGHQRSNLRGELVDLIGTTVTLWINPQDLVSEDPSDAQRQIIYRDLVDPFEVVIKGIGLEAGDDSSNRPAAELVADEIRLGTTWDSVTPVVGGKPDDGGENTTWAGLSVDDRGYVYAGDKLKWLDVSYAPWVYSFLLETWIYLPESKFETGKTWIYGADFSK